MSGAELALLAALLLTFGGYAGYWAGLLLIDELNRRRRRRWPWK